MKVLLTTYNYPPQVGGIEQHVSELATHLNAKHDVRVLWFNDSEDIDSNYPLDVVKAPVTVENSPFDSMFVTAAKQALEIRNQIDKFNPDIIHAHSFGLCYSLGLVKLEQNVPIVVTNHSSRFLRRFYSDSKVNTLKQKFEGMIPDAVITPSAELRQTTQEITSAPVEEIPNGVDVNKFVPNEKEELEIEGYKTEGKFIVLSTRRFVPKNGMKYLVRSVKHANDDVLFLMLGDGPEQSHLKSWLQEQDLQNQAAILGEVPNEDIAKYYKLSDISVLPSLKEAISISGLESMACGTPVIGTNVGGIPELIDHGTNGLLVEPKDPEAIGNAVNHLSNSPDLLTNMGEKAREKIVADYSWKAITQKTENLYERVLQDKNGK